MKKLFDNITKTDIRNIIGVLYVIGSMIFIYLLVFFPVPAQNKDLLNILAGGYFGGLGPILGYYFGSSKTNDHKDG